MSFNTLAGDIKTLLDSISGISQVKSTPSLNFSGFPAVSISEDRVDNQMLSKQENERVFSYRIRVFYDTTDGINTAVENLEAAVKSILNKLAEEEKLSTTRTIGVSLDSDDTIISLEPTIGDFVYHAAVSMMSLTITLNIHVIHDFGITDTQEVPIAAGVYIGLPGGFTYASS